MVVAETDTRVGMEMYRRRLARKRVVGCTKAEEEGWLDEKREGKDEEVWTRLEGTRTNDQRGPLQYTHDNAQTLKATPVNVLALTLMAFSYLYPTHSM